MHPDQDKINHFSEKLFPSMLVKQIPYEEDIKLANVSSCSNTIESINYSYMINLIKYSPDFISIKNTESIIIGSSNPIAKLAGLNTPNEIIGKTDKDFIWGKGGYAGAFDKKVLSGNIIYLIARYHYFDKNRTILIKKVPLLDKGANVIGIVDFLSEIENPHLTNVITRLSKWEINMPTKLVKDIQKYTIEDTYKKYNLSKREEECIYYLLRGYSSKQIARVLEISHRTIDSYIDNIKDKFRCTNRSSLICKATEAGCINLLPRTILLKSSRVS